MPETEVEIRSIITSEEYEELLGFFRKNAAFVREEFQETIYFEAPKDLRMRKSDSFTGIILKKGRMHDDHREEIEVAIEEEDFEKGRAMIGKLGFEECLIWKRKRIEFSWRGVSVYLDNTEDYGHIIEMEVVTEKGEEERQSERLRAMFEELGVEITPREELERRFECYKKRNYLIPCSKKENQD